MYTNVKKGGAVVQSINRNPIAGIIALFFSLLDRNEDAPCRTVFLGYCLAVILYG